MRLDDSCLGGRFLLDLLRRNRAAYREAPKSAEELVRVGLAPRPKDAEAPELAAWTAVSRAVLNLSEAIVRE